MKSLESFYVGKNKCKKCISEYNRKRRNLPGIREKKQSYQREYHQRQHVKTKEHARRQTSEYKEYQREYQQRHRIRINTQCRKRRKEDPAYRMKLTLRSRLHSALRGSSNAETIVGCTHEELKSHIEAQFLPGMSWENRGGDDGWHVDHIIPFDAFDMTKEEDQCIVNWYMNLQPLWGPDDRMKSNKYKEEDKLDLIRRYENRL